MEKKKMIVEKIQASIKTGLYDVFLKEEDGEKMLNIIIGEFEARSILTLIDGIKIPRPLIYDLFYNVLNEYEIVLDEIIITKFFEGVYYAEIILSSKEGKKVFDARVSDAINMALKYNCSIFASREILDDVGFAEEELDDIDSKSSSIAKQIEDLEYLLQIAIEQEEYDAAAILRDRIDKLKQKK